MAKPKKTALNDASKSLKETERRIRVVEKQIKKTGRLRDPKSGSFVKVTKRNITKVSRALVKDVKQSSKTLKAASKFASTIADLFKSKKGGAKSTPKKQTSKTSKLSDKLSKKNFARGTTKSITRGQQTVSVSTPSKKKQSKSSIASQELPSQLTRNRAYQTIDLPQSFQSRVFNDTLENLEKVGKGYDQKFLTQPGDVWGWKIGYRNHRGQWVGGYGTSTFSTFERMIRQIHGYGSGGGAAKGGAFDPNLYDSPELNDTQAQLFHIVRFNGPHPGKENRPTWQQQRSAFNMAKAESKKKYGEKKKAQETTRFEKRAKIADERAERKAEKKYEAKYQKKIADLEAELSRFTKRTRKGAK